MIASKIVGGNPENGRRKNDLYPTPPEATVALLDFLNLPQGTKVWEPACGEGDMVKVMEAYGLRVCGTDIQQGKEFLIAPCPSDTSWIITNPPFSIADRFIETASKHGLPFAFLLKSHYWHAAKRYKLFMDVPPTYVLPLTWRPNFYYKEDNGGSPLMDVMWCVWFPALRRNTSYIPLKKPNLEEYAIADDTVSTQKIRNKEIEHA